MIPCCLFVFSSGPYIPKSVFSQTPKLDQNNIKHTIPESVVQKRNNMFFLIPALMKFIRNSLV